MQKKIKKTIRLSMDLKQQIEDECVQTGETENSVIENALGKYFAEKTDPYEKIADLFLQKYNEKYKNWMTRVRLGIRTADVNSQVMLEVFNTLLMAQQVPGEFFVSADETKHPVLLKAEKVTSAKIQKYKQIKDNKGK